MADRVTIKSLKPEEHRKITCLFELCRLPDELFEANAWGTAVASEHNCRHYYLVEYKNILLLLIVT